MKKKIIVLLRVVVAFCFLLSFFVYNTSATTEGLIGSYTTSSYEYDAQEGLYPDALVVGEDATYVYVAIVSTGDTGTEGDGYVRTVKVSKTDGTYTASLIDSLEFDTSDCYYPSICYCGTNGGLYYYAIVYCDTGSSKETIVTVSISQTGDIGNSVVDTQQMTYDGADASGGSHILKWSGTTYLIAYTVSDFDGWFETYTISDAGVITNSVIDTQEFDTADGRFPRMVATDSDTVAVVYGGTDTGGGVAFDGFIRTYNVSSGGTITNTQADSLEFDTNQGTQPDIIKTGSTYVIAYEGLDADGYLCGLSITSGWDIQVPTGYLEHDTGDAGCQRLTLLGTSKISGVGSVYALTYQSLDGDGFLKTFASLSQRDVYEFDTADSLNFAPMFFINYTFWGVAYAGTGNDGFVKTVNIDNEYDLTLYDTATNTKGTHEYNIQDTYYNVWANYTTTMMLRENLNTWLTGTHEYKWNSSTGNMMVWANYSGADCNIGSTTHEGNWSASASYSGVSNIWLVTITVNDNVNMVEDIGNAIGTHELQEKPSYFSATQYDIKHYGNWTVWANYTSDYEIQSPLDNVVKCDWNGSNWYIDFKQPPASLGGAGWDLIGIPKNTNVPFNDVHLRNATNNYTWDEAVTNGIIYPFVTGWLGTNYYLVTNSTFCAYHGYWIYSYDTSYSLWVNTSSAGSFDGNSSGNWLWVAGLSLETGELGLLFVTVLFILAFVVDRQDKQKSLWKPIMLFMDVPVSLATGLFYLGNSLFSVHWWVGIILISFAVILSMAGLYYALDFGRK